MKQVLTYLLWGILSMLVVFLLMLLAAIVGSGYGFF
jgi:hypothetical protein